MSVTIDLQRYGLTRVDSADLDVFRLRLVTANPVGIDPNIFVFIRQPLALGSEDQVNKFTNVASVADMAEYPVDDPNVDNEFPFFRSNEVILDFRSSADYEYGLDEIRARVEQLLAATARLSSLTSMETYNLTS